MQNGNVAVRENSELLRQQTIVIRGLEAFSKMNEIPFTEDNKRIVRNMLSTIDRLLSSKNKNWNNINRDNLNAVLQQATFLGLDPAAMPRECAVILRGNLLEIQIEGAGNDVILKKFGEDVKEIRSYIVYEGDEFTLPRMVGWDYQLPNHERTYKSDKAMYAVYLIKLNNGSIDVRIADREAVRVSLFGQMRNNGADEAFLRNLGDKTLDEMLFDEKLITMKIKNKWGTESDLISGAYSSIVSREAMIERKMRNHAIRKFPKNFSSKIVEDLYEATFEEARYDNQNTIENQKTNLLEEYKNDQENDPKNVFDDDLGKDVGKKIEVVKTEDLVHSEDVDGLTEDFDNVDNDDLENLVENEPEKETPTTTEEDVPDWY